MTKLIIALKNRFYKILSISMCECEALRLFLLVEILLEKNHKHFFTLTNIYLSKSVFQFKRTGHDTEETWENDSSYNKAERSEYLCRWIRIKLFLEQVFLLQKSNVLGWFMEKLQRNKNNTFFFLKILSFHSVPRSYQKKAIRSGESPTGQLITLNWESRHLS